MQRTLYPLFALALLTGCPAEKPSTGAGQQPAQPASQPSGAPAAPSGQPASAPAGQPASQPSGALPAGGEQKVARGASPETRDEVDPDGVVRRGQALSSGPTLTVSELVAQSGALAGKTVKVRGELTSVCAKKGCWFEMVGSKPEERLRVTATGYSFFMPKEVTGLVATIEGELNVQELDVATAQHLEDERVMGKDEKPKKITAPVKELAVVAQAVEAKKKS